ncbi:MAG: hypothetical protein NMNS01_22970 [Nitrosomonas sp.]|nr:MAG: hypothetical protein NMNS01_22970 [Nitrosomonas sp.]
MRVVLLIIFGLAAVLPGTLTADKDPASLDGLADIVTLPPVSEWPPDIAWFVVTGSVLMWLSAIAYAAWLRRRNNAYREAALAELDRIELNPAASMRIAEILKRTALSTAPRRNVAALTGEDWMQWLNQTGNGVMFSERSRQILSECIYGAGQTGDEEIKVLASTARRWVEKHQTNFAAASAGLFRMKNS